MRYAITGVNAARTQEAAKWLLRYVATGHSAIEHIAGFTQGRLQYLGTEIKPPANLFQFNEGSESTVQLGPVFTTHDYVRAELRRADALLNHPCCDSWQDQGLCTCGEQSEEDFVREERVNGRRAWRYFDSETATARISQPLPAKPTLSKPVEPKPSISKPDNTGIEHIVSRFNLLELE